MQVSSPLRLRSAERTALEDMAAASERHPALTMRAQIVLRAATGAPNTTIARDLGVSRPTVIAWRRRYAEGGLTGLRDLPRPGRPRGIDETLVVAATFARPPQPAPARPWSTRTLSSAIGVNHSSIADVWRRWDLRPGGSDPLSIPASPPMAPWARDIVGIYLNPPEYALAVTADSTAAAPPSLDALLGDGPGAPLSRRTSALLAAMAFAADRLDENCPPLLAHEQFIEFLARVVRGHPRRTVRLLLRNASSVHHPETRYWLARRRTVHLHLAPESPDWFAVAHVLMSFAALNAGYRQPIAATRSIVDAMRDFATGWDEGRAHFSWHEPLTGDASGQWARRA